jgi:hypothetical protein
MTLALFFEKENGFNLYIKVTHTKKLLKFYYKLLITNHGSAKSTHELAT